MTDIVIGIDNGTSGSIGIVDKDGGKMFLVPNKSEQDYTKKKKNITRLEVECFKRIVDREKAIAVMERPLVNPKMFKATEGALRCFEAELCILESLKMPHIFIDSKEWQREVLPKGIKGREELKKASFDIGLRLFPNESELIKRHKDADGLLIAYYYYCLTHNCKV